MILVTGCARSGTSLTTRILKAHGCWLGKPGEVNILYENTSVRQGVLKPYLKSLGCDPLGQKKLPDTNNLKPVPDLREKVLSRIGGQEPTAYKDAKITLVWPVFAHAFPDARWVLVRRDRERIIDSCLRTEFMWSYSHREQWGAWVDEHERRFADMRTHLDLIEVWPDRIMEEPEAFASIAEHCGLTFNRQAVERCIDKDKWHSASVAAVA